MEAYPGDDIPRSVDDQADFWADYYRTQQALPRQQYIDKVEDLEEGGRTSFFSIFFLIETKC